MCEYKFIIVSVRLLSKCSAIPIFFESNHPFGFLSLFSPRKKLKVIEIDRYGETRVFLLCCDGKTYIVISHEHFYAFKLMF